MFSSNALPPLLCGIILLLIGYSEGAKLEAKPYDASRQKLPLTSDGATLQCCEMLLLEDLQCGDLEFSWVGPRVPQSFNKYSLYLPYTAIKEMENYTCTAEFKMEGGEGSNATDSSRAMIHFHIHSEKKSGSGTVVIVVVIVVVILLLAVGAALFVLKKQKRGSIEPELQREYSASKMDRINKFMKDKFSVGGSSEKNASNNARALAGSSLESATKKDGPNEQKHPEEKNLVKDGDGAEPSAKKLDSEKPVTKKSKESVSSNKKKGKGDGDTPKEHKKSSDKSSRKSEAAISVKKPSKEEIINLSEKDPEKGEKEEMENSKPTKEKAHKVVEEKGKSSGEEKKKNTVKAEDGDKKANKSGEGSDEQSRKAKKKKKKKPSKEVKEKIDGKEEKKSSSKNSSKNSKEAAKSGGDTNN